MPTTTKGAKREKDERSGTLRHFGATAQRTFANAANAHHGAAEGCGGKQLVYAVGKHIGRVQGR